MKLFNGFDVRGSMIEFKKLKHFLSARIFVFIGMKFAIIFE